VARVPLDDRPVRALGDVQVRLVDAHLADDVRALVEDFLHVRADGLVELHVDGPVEPALRRVGGVRAVGVGVRAPRQSLQGGRDRHRGVDAVLAGLVARRRDRADVVAGLVPHPHDDGFALEFGFAEALTGRVEAVHVDVEHQLVGWAVVDRVRAREGHVVRHAHR